MSTPSFRPDLNVWQTFCADRQDYLKALAEVVAQSFSRRDTAHPAFSGCIDWHSSVHGAYALLVAARLSGHLRLAEIVNSAFHPDRLAAELASFRRGDLQHELPYGYAWFLQLAQEREQGWNTFDLLPLATDIASRLANWIVSLSDEAVVSHVQQRAYGNLSWPLLNLWQWGTWKQDAELLERLSEFTRTRLFPLDQECPDSLDRATDEFFSPALQRCRVLLTILSSDESLTWLDSRPSETWAGLPLTVCLTPHSAGLNFSRSWGLWTLWQHTRDQVFRDEYVNHIVTHMTMPQYWRDDYGRHGHWVPQFGIHAIALSMEESGFHD